MVGARIFAWILVMFVLDIEFDKAYQNGLACVNDFFTNIMGCYAPHYSIITNIISSSLSFTGVFFCCGSHVSLKQVLIIWCHLSHTKECRAEPPILCQFRIATCHLCMYRWSSDGLPVGTCYGILPSLRGVPSLRCPPFGYRRSGRRDERNPNQRD